MTGPQDNPQHPATPPKPARNMHEGVEIWEDTCVCQPEPRWQKVAEQQADERVAAERAAQAEPHVESACGK